jgi:membrane associated rhomboid family serine protease
MGTLPFIVLYLAGLLISHAGTYYKQRRNPEYACLGASGAISAVLFAAIVYFPEQSLIILPIPIPIPAPLFAVLYLAYTYYASKNAHGRINHDAHLGGAITGLLFVAVTEPRAYGNLLQSIL